MLELATKSGNVSPNSFEETLIRQYTNKIEKDGSQVWKLSKRGRLLKVTGLMVTGSMSRKLSEKYLVEKRTLMVLIETVGVSQPGMVLVPTLNLNYGLLADSRVGKVIEAFGEARIQEFGKFVDKDNRILHKVDRLILTPSEFNENRSLFLQSSCPYRPVIMGSIGDSGNILAGSYTKVCPLAKLAAMTLVEAM